MNYKNKHNGQVISESCYRALPLQRRNDYVQSNNIVTHKVEDDGTDILTTILTVGTIIDAFSSDSPSSNYDNPSDSGSPDVSFGGGDFGGGGASGDF